MSSTSLITQAEALGDTNKVVDSPPQGDDLQAQSRLSPRLRPWVMRIEESFYHLGEVVCELNLAYHPG